MTDDDLEQRVRAMTFWTGKNSMTIEEMAVMQPGLARLMPEVGTRTWKMYYAADAGNWPMARFQHKEITNLFEMGAFMRPKHADALNEYLEQHWHPLGRLLAARDLAGFQAAFPAAIDAANAYHELKDKPYIRWVLPGGPPPDLDLSPRDDPGR